MTGLRLAIALAVLAGLLLPAPRVLAISGVELPSAQQVLDSADLIVVARAGEVLGVVDSVDRGLRSLYRLDVESYLRPSLPGPDTLVLSVLGGIGLDRAMDGPQPGSGRRLYFLKRTGDVYVKAAGPFTPTLPLAGGDFASGRWGWEQRQSEFAFLLDWPRYPSVPPPVVQLKGRRIGGAPMARLVSGRTLFPARALSAATGATFHYAPADGVLRLERSGTILSLTAGTPTMAVRTTTKAETVPLDIPPQADGDELLIPLRAVAAVLGAGVHWDAANWTVALTLPDAPVPPAYLGEAEAIGHLAAAVDAVLDQHGSSRTFTGYYSVAAARFRPDWIDPRTGGERPVWELDVALRTGEFMATAMVDARTGALLFYRDRQPYRR